MGNKPTLQEVDHIHDSDPANAAEYLRILAADGSVPADEQPRLCWLINHVIGEKLDRWKEARDLLAGVVQGAEDPRCLAHLAVAAHLAGDPLLAWKTADRLGAEAEVPAPVTACLIRLTTLQFAAANLEARDLASMVSGCVALLAQEPELGPLGKPIAAALNNVLVLLLDHPNAHPADPTYHHALLDGARVCRTIWLRVGNWLNDERANYLVALCANRVSDWSAARLAAEGALDTIRLNGEEDVDRAFILLELARAQIGLGDKAEAEATHLGAEALAQHFDADLRKWFDVRAAG